MRKKFRKVIFLLVALICFWGVSFSQQVKCSELIGYVENEGKLKGTVSSIQLLQSSWLSEVKAYEIENTIVVIAQIYTDNFSLNKKKYIFCGISEAEWTYFSNPMSNPTKSYGERFRERIFDNKCNCYD
jgi:hypothetical protein